MSHTAAALQIMHPQRHCGPRWPPDQLTGVDGSRPSAPASTIPSTRITPVHRTRSRTRFRSPHVSYAASAANDSTCPPAGHGVTVDPQGFRFVKNPLLPTFDTTLGPRSQTLVQIGQTGAMVLRMRMPHGADAEPCRLQRKTREREPQHFLHT